MVQSARKFGPAGDPTTSSKCARLRAVTFGSTSHMTMLARAMLDGHAEMDEGVGGGGRVVG